MPGIKKTLSSQRPSRRRVLQGAAATTGVLAAPMIMTRAAFADAPMLGAGHGGYHRLALGGFEVTSISDGATTFENPQSVFGTDQTVETVSELLTEENLPTDKMVIGFTPVVVNTGSELVLFDTGLGAGAREGGMGKLRETLGTAGYTPEQIDVVVITHMHPDHIGGLMEDGAPAFANARYVTGQAEFDFWSAEERMTGPTEGVAKQVNSNVKPLAENFTFIDGGTDVVSGITSIAAFGHTPGHMAYNIESDGKRLVLVADAANHYVLSLQKPDWEVRFDIDKAAAAAARKELFGMIAADGVPFIGYHMPFPSVGYVEPMDGGFRYSPETYQLDL
ncbi:MAG: MBL fold metallo-hydrolase [Pseudomonadota bacterium]